MSLPEPFEWKNYNKRTGQGDPSTPMTASRMNEWWQTFRAWVLGQASSLEAIVTGGNASLTATRDAAVSTVTAAGQTALDARDEAVAHADMLAAPAIEQVAAFLRGIGGNAARDVLGHYSVAAVGDGTDESAAWAAAINAAANAGGGVVTAPRNRTYRVTNLPLRPNVWLDLRGIVLRQPVNPTTPMFVAPTLANFVSGGILGGELWGYNKTRHGLDFSAVTTLEHFVVDGAYIHDFDRAYNGSGNDRYFVLGDSRVWYNNVGAYVTMNHPILRFCDFRYNDVALTGNINDLYAVGVKFNIGRVGIQPDATVSGAKIQNSQFVACVFGKNTEKGAVVDRYNTFTGCLFYGNNSNDDGLTLKDAGNVVTSNYFGYMADVGTWGGAAVRFAGNAGANQDGNLIDSNLFLIRAGSGVGIGATGTPVLRNTMIRGNTVRVENDRKFIDLSGVTLANSKVSGNSVVVPATSTHLAGTGIMEFGSLGAGGTDFVDNVIFSDRASNPASAIRINSQANGCSFVGNRVRGFAAPAIVATGGGLSQARWRANHGFDTATSGTATVAAGATTVVVTHGLAFQPSPQNVMVTPTSSTGAATRFWVTSVGATQFTISVDVAPGGSGASFAWSADVGR